VIRVFVQKMKVKKILEKYSILAETLTDKLEILEITSMKFNAANSAFLIKQSKGQ